MKSFDKLDTFLLDRVFQPLCDACSRWTTCFGLARIALVLSSVALHLSLLALVQLKQPLMPDKAMGAGVMALMWLWIWNRDVRTAEREMPRNLAFRNRRRIEFLPLRSMCLGCSLPCLPYLALKTPASNMELASEGLCLVSIGCWIVMQYLSACQPNPPEQKVDTRAAGWLGAMLGR